MKKLLFWLPVLVLLASFAPAENDFTGKIVYRYSFSDYRGTNLDAKLGPIFGTGQQYYIAGKNYKTHTPDNKLQQLYVGETNTYYYLPDGQQAQKIDATQGSSKTFLISRLTTTEKIAGYECQAVKIETDAAITVYYYTPEIKINAATFAQHKFGDWNKYLQVTGGALALKYVMTNKNNGIIWTASATEVTKKPLGAAEFVLPETVQVKL